MNLQTLVLKVAAGKPIADALEWWRVQREPPMVDQSLASGGGGSFATASALFRMHDQRRPRGRNRAGLQGAAPQNGENAIRGAHDLARLYSLRQARERPARAWETRQEGR